jgi:hypothetical protein
MRKAREDDRQLDISDLSDEQLDRLKDILDDEVTYDDSGNRIRRSDLDKRKEQQMKSYNKPEDVVRVCKGIADQGSTSLSEAELTGVITAYGKSIYPDMRPDAAFAKVYTADNEIGIAFRKAVQIAKGLAVIYPIVTTDDSVNDPANALEALEQLVEQQRAAHPH